MSRNGSGIYTAPYRTFTPDTVISSTQANANIADLETALTGSLPRDGQAAPTANIPFGTHKITGLGAGVSATDSVNFGQVQAQAYIWCSTAGGTKNALTLTPSPDITDYEAGQIFRFISGAANSDDAVTVAVSGLATKAIQNNGSALSASVYIEAGKVYEIIYDGTQFQILKTSATSGYSGGFKNLLINGDFSVWQRGSARYPTYGLSGILHYYADRWSCGQYQDSAFERVARSGDGPASLYAMRVTSSSAAEAAAGTRMALGQAVPKPNCVHLAGQSVTLSFWVRFSNSSSGSFGNFNYALWEYDTELTDFSSDAPTRMNAVTITNGALPTTWAKYTKTVTVGAGMNNLAARFSFFSSATTTNSSDFWYEIADIQLEAGSVATNFERRPYGVEEAQCQRYYYRLTPAAGETFGLGQVFNATGATIQVPFPVPMRVRPTALEQSGTASHYRMWNAAASPQDCTFVPTFSSVTTTTIGGAIFTSASLSGTAGQVTTSFGTGSGYLGWSAEI